ncbi:MAG TPA: type II secretion system protein [Tepidanaerobacteraceae bacterium]|nr:type II secretion system protein [Tepidanaerobacteraceae bacterium]
MIMKIARALHKRTKGDKGFTLIELIVVIAVLGVLATLIIPKVVGVKSDAETKAMQANERIIRNALERYYLDNDEYPEALGDLVEKGYLPDEIPDDFEKPDVYKRENDGKNYSLTLIKNTEPDDEPDSGDPEKN